MVNIIFVFINIRLFSCVALHNTVIVPLFYHNVLIMFFMLMNIFHKNGSKYTFIHIISNVPILYFSNTCWLYARREFDKCMFTFWEACMSACEDLGMANIGAFQQQYSGACLGIRKRGGPKIFFAFQFFRKFQKIDETMTFSTKKLAKYR